MLPLSRAAPPLPLRDGVWARTELMEPCMAVGWQLLWEHGAQGWWKRLITVDRAGAQQEQVPHGGRSEGLLLGYFFNIF